jgi:hypothetical protein
VTARFVACALALALALPRPAAAAPSADAEVMARHVLIALRVLAYDRALSTRVATTDVVVMIVSAPTKASHDDRDRWLSGFALLPNVKTGGKRVRATAVDLTTEKAFDEAIAKGRPALLIVGPGLEKDLATIRRITRKYSVLSFSPREAEVRKGIAFGTAEEGDDKRVVVNVDAARAEGVKFAAGLLQLARLVEESQP